MISYEDYRSIGNAIDFAKEQDTVNMVIQDDEMHVKGDPNDTKLEKYHYTVRFAFPKTEKYRKMLKNETILKETDNYLLIEQEYKDVFVSPRLHSSVIASFADVYKLYVYITDDGEVRELNGDEARVVLEMMNEEMTASLYHAVATVLGVSKEFEDFMLIGDVVKTMINLIMDFPEIINDTDLFFA